MQGFQSWVLRGMSGMNQDDPWTIDSFLSENETGRASIRSLVDVSLDVEVIV